MIKAVDGTLVRVKNIAPYLDAVFDTNLTYTVRQSLITDMCGKTFSVYLHGLVLETVPH